MLALAILDDLASHAGYSLVVAGSGQHGVPRAGLQQLLQHGIDGLLVLGSQPHGDWTTPFVSANVPIVQIGHGKRTKGMRRVAINEEVGAVALAKHLLGLGHRDFGFLAGVTWGQQRRLRYYRHCARDCGVALNPEWDSLCEGLHGPAGSSAMHDLLRQAGRRRPTAVMCVSDELAIGAIRALRDAGVRIPEDMSVTGCGDMPISPLLVPSLTTVHYPIESLARMAFDLVTDRDKFWKAEQDTILVDPEPRIRESCGPVER
jgi:DNA-binding LacI/PurR family transcriptional regulator